jgi:hypothetical protein
MKLPSLGPFIEPQLPLDDPETTIAFYEQMGCRVTSRTTWGMLQLSDPAGHTLTLFPRQFWPEAALAFHSPDLRALKLELVADGIPIEEDSVDLEPPRLSFRDPSGNLIYAYLKSAGPSG